MKEPKTMAEVTEHPTTSTRKDDHIRINLEENVQFPSLTTGLEKYAFIHRAVPEVDLSQVDTRLSLFGKQVASPILISSMTGGAVQAGRINIILAEAAQERNIAMGLGSQRAAIEDETLAATFQIRDVAPNILLFANLGAIQLNYGYGIDQARRAVEMASADALILHFNVLQEAVQPEGDTNFAGLLNHIEKLASQADFPLIAKEVGWGFSESDVRRLSDAGISAFDVAGAGGTSWSEVEYHRAPSTFHAQVARAFANWGIPTADAIRYARNAAPDATIIASGGLRDGIDVAKTVALGSSLAGLASPFLKAASQSVEATIDLIDVLHAQLRIAMLCSAAPDIATLRTIPLIKHG